jgi:nucleotide-binding universal stress UspA family protein
MTYKTVLVHAEANPEAAPRLEVAGAVARHFNARLVGLGAEWLDWIGVSDPYGMMAADWMTVMRDQMEQDLKAAQAQFEKHAGAADHHWLRVMDPPAAAMARLARSADLIVTGGAPLSDRAQPRTADPVDLVLLSGRPVLVAPPKGGELKARKIVVAWKDTREARRAVADALPFLKDAEEVVVMEACHTDDFGDAQYRTSDVVEHLQRHGVKARPLAKIVVPERVAIELNIEAQAIDADLIVCGAYGHNRVQEWVLGGVTHDLLHYPERFVLLSH